MDVTKTGNGEWGMGNGEWGMGNGEWEIRNENWEIVASGIITENLKCTHRRRSSARRQISL